MSLLCVCDSLLVNRLLHRLFFRSWHHFLFLENIEKIRKKLSKVFGKLSICSFLKIFWKIEHLLQKEQALNFP